MEINKSIYYAGFVIIVGLGLSYVFFGADLIPDSVAALTPKLFVGFLDDALALIAMVLALGRWKKLILGDKGEKRAGTLAIVAYIGVIAAILGYVFWGVDLIPDTTPFVGWFDDVIAVLMGTYVLGKVKQWLKS